MTVALKAGVLTFGLAQRFHFHAGFDAQYFVHRRIVRRRCIRTKFAGPQQAESRLQPRLSVLSVLSAFRFTSLAAAFCFEFPRVLSTFLAIVL